jgi:hypothetical protein
MKPPEGEKRRRKKEREEEERERGSVTLGGPGVSEWRHVRRRDSGGMTQSELWGRTASHGRADGVMTKSRQTT